MILSSTTIVHLTRRKPNVLYSLYVRVRPTNLGEQDLGLDMASICGSRLLSSLGSHETSTSPVTGPRMVSLLAGLSVALSCLSWGVLQWNMWPLSRSIVVSTEVSVIVVMVGVEIVVRVLRIRFVGGRLVVSICHAHEYPFFCMACQYMYPCLARYCTGKSPRWRCGVPDAKVG